MVKNGLEWVIVAKNGLFLVVKNGSQWSIQ
jgi:hypothetical protein